ncbi:hypothetical protein DFH09DRAFT_1099738 [Mycena vulgaris]|nr:hypothetical protein DFH09DRAFT_1099738 [Mycena vulgaris]
MGENEPPSPRYIQTGAAFSAATGIPTAGESSLVCTVLKNLRTWPSAHIDDAHLRNGPTHIGQTPALQKRVRQGAGYTGKGGRGRRKWDCDRGGWVQDEGTSTGRAGWTGRCRIRTRAGAGARVLLRVVRSLRLGAPGMRWLGELAMASGVGCSRSSGISAGDRRASLSARMVIVEKEVGREVLARAIASCEWAPLAGGGGLHRRRQPKAKDGGHGVCSSSAAGRRRACAATGSPSRGPSCRGTHGIRLTCLPLEEESDAMIGGWREKRKRAAEAPVLNETHVESSRGESVNDVYTTKLAIETSESQTLERKEKEMLAD